MFLATALMMMGGVSDARADERIVAKVPFAFIVHGVRLPAGDYTVTQNVFDGGGVFLIASADGRHAVYTLTSPSASGKEPAQPELVFEKFGEQYFLARVVPRDGDERKIVLTPSIMERELAEVALNP